MGILILTVFLTLAVSAFCSMLEAMVLSTTQLEIEVLKRRTRHRGELLETFVREIDKTTSAILTLNTTANTFGATLSGVLFAGVFGHGFASTYIFPAILTVAILTFSEILPKNLGVLYRPFLQPYLVYPLHWVRILMYPLSGAFGFLLGMLTSRKNSDNQSGDDEILMLAEKGAKDGRLTMQEKTLIQNSLELDDVEVSEIMTPRMVVQALDEDMSIAEVFAGGKSLSFGRLPTFKDTIDNITGVVRRRDLLTAKAQDKDSLKVKDFIQSALFVPENGSALSILRQLIKNHQQIGMVVDEFASFTGVVTLEDIFEKLLGSEIFENDDIAVDMRELAKKRKLAAVKKEAASKKNSQK